MKKPYLTESLDLNSKKIIEVLDELPFWSAPFGIKLLENINYRKNLTALDIGFGAGFPLTEIAMRLGESSKVYGIDPWEAAVDRAETKLDVYGIKNVELFRTVSEKIPLLDNTVDLIVSNNGLNNVSDLNKTLSECARIIKTGGQFIQTVNLNNTMIEFYTVLEQVLTKKGLHPFVEKLKLQIYEKRKPLEEYIDTIESHGFITKKVIHDQFDYRYVDGTTMLNHYFIRLAFLESWKELVPIDQQNDIFDEVERRMNINAQNDGMFVLTVPFVVIDCLKC